MAFSNTIDDDLTIPKDYNAYPTHPPSFTPGQLNKDLNLGHAGVNVVGAVLNSLNICVLILLLRRNGCTKNVYGLFLAVGVFDLSMVILWSVFLFIVYARKGSPLPISPDPLLHDSKFHYLFINLAPNCLNLLSTASELVILAMAVLSLIHTVIRSKSWISLPEAIAVIIGALVVSVALVLPSWLLTELIAWKDRHVIASPDFYGSDFFVYIKAYDIITVYISYGLKFLLVILLICVTRRYSLKEECHKVVVMLAAVLAWGLICDTPYILVQAIWHWGRLTVRLPIITMLEIARYGTVLKESARGLVYFSCNSLYRQTVLCRAQSLPAAPTAAPEGQVNTAM